MRQQFNAVDAALLETGGLYYNCRGERPRAVGGEYREGDRSADVANAKGVGDPAQGEWRRKCGSDDAATATDEHGAVAEHAVLGDEAPSHRLSQADVHEEEPVSSGEC